MLIYGWNFDGNATAKALQFQFVKGFQFASWKRPVIIC